MDVALDAEIGLDGIEGLERPIKLRATGPFRSSEGELPSFDIDLDISADGAGQGISTGAVSTGDRAWVKFEDSYYELDQGDVDENDNRCRKEGIGINPRPWVEDAKDEGDEKVGGVETTHVSATLDVERMLGGLNEFVERCGRLLSSAAGSVPNPLKEGDIEAIAERVEDPSFDVYVAKEDDTIRRLSASLDVKLSEKDQEAVGGLKGASLRFSIEFSDLNGDQLIEAPARSRPLSDLTSQLGGNLGLGGSEGQQGNQPRDQQSPEQPSLDNFQNYSDCLDRAEPDDTEALSRCSALLNAP
jgi:hypothetical protein